MIDEYVNEKYFVVNIIMTVESNSDVIECARFVTMLWLSWNVRMINNNYYDCVVMIIMKHTSE